MIGAEVRIEGVSKSFGLHQVLEDLTLTLAPGGVYCLMAPSGSGKTTLLRMLAGLEHPSAGRIVGLVPGEASVMFQEDRLREMLTPVENVALLHPDRRVSRRGIRAGLSQILPERSLDQPVHKLSGGMRRRVSLACAMTYPGRTIILDEPFTGLDEKTRHEVIRYVTRHQEGRTLIVATHNREDVALLGAQLITLGAT